MKYTKNMLIIIATAMNIITVASQDVIIRQAKMKDLAAINSLCHQTHHDSGFKTGLDQALNGWMMAGSITNTFINAQVNLFVEQQKHKNAECFKQQKGESAKNRLLVAYTKDSGNIKRLAAYCLFNKDNVKQIYMSYFVVDSAVRSQGIGKCLIQKAFQTFDGITSCKFRWLAKDTTMNDFFEKHCIEVNNVHLDYCSGRILEEVPKEEFKDGKIVLPILFREFVFDLKIMQ